MADYVVEFDNSVGGQGVVRVDNQNVDLTLRFDRHEVETYTDSQEVGRVFFLTEDGIAAYIDRNANTLRLDEMDFQIAHHMELSVSLPDSFVSKLFRKLDGRQFSRKEPLGRIEG